MKLNRLPFLIAGLLAACEPVTPTSLPEPTPQTEVTLSIPPVDLGRARVLEQQTVKRVVDGDTIVLTNDERVRLIGIDTPESVKPNSPVECYGKESTDYIKTLLPAGTPVLLEDDADLRDRYDRRLAYIYRVSDQLFINAEMVRAGYAEAMTVKPNVAHKSEFEALEDEAANADRGLWGAC